jgi:pimeloyl-ACP methyl ester carboxylesterase
MTCRRVALAVCLLVQVAGARVGSAQGEAWAKAPATGLPAGGTERHGVIPITTPAGRLEKRAVLRVPARGAWNGALVIGAHGGSGGNNFDATGKVIGTDETALDDVIGRHALAQGFAYASVDRDGIGGTRQGLDLTYAFTELAAEETARLLGRAPAHRYLVGLSMGGGITRMAAEDPQPRFAGVVIIAGAGGDLATRRTRQARLAALWPALDPAANPALAADDPKLRAYAEVIGTPVAARRLWPYTSANAVRAALANAPAATGEDSTKRLHVPAIEVVGTWDDFVLAELKVYEAQVQPRAQHRLYQVEGVWHMSGDDDGTASFQYAASRMKLDPDVARAMGEGPSYIPTVRDAFDRLVRWVRDGAAPPPSQTVAPGARLK